MSNHPPLFTVLLAAWRACGLGEDEWSIRLLPVLLGVAGIAALYLAGKRLFSERAGLMAAFLLAISPFHVLQSQDLKEYIVLPVTGTVAVVCLYEAVRRDTDKVNIPDLQNKLRRRIDMITETAKKLSKVAAEV